MTPEQIQEQLEQLIDANNLQFVLEQLAEVLYGKAEHIASNWQDDAMAAAYNHCAGQVNNVAAWVENNIS